MGNSIDSNLKKNKKNLETYLIQRARPAVFGRCRTCAVGVVVVAVVVAVVGKEAEVQEVV